MGSSNRQGRVVMAVVSLLLVAVLVSACQENGGAYQAGQAFRQQVDIALADAGQFIAGFCSSAALPGLAAVVVAWFAANRRGA